MTLRALLLSVGMSLAACSPGAELPKADMVFAPTRTLSVAAIDDREIAFYLDAPSAPGQVPLLVSIDGSGCSGQLREGSAELFKPGVAYAANYRPFARLMVEKPGVEHGWTRETEHGFDIAAGTALEEAMLAWLLEGEAADALLAEAGLR